MCTELLISGPRTSSPSHTGFSTSLAPFPVFNLSSIISFSYSKVSWADWLILRLSWNLAQCYAFYRHASIWKNIYVSNIINSIRSIGTYINTRTILMLIILLSLHSTTLFRTFWYLSIMIIIWVYPAVTQQGGITLPSLTMWSAISYPVAVLVSTKNIVKFYPGSTWNHFKGNSYTKFSEIWGHWEISLCIYNTTYSSSNSSHSKVHWNLEHGINGAFRPLLLLMKSISSSQCPTFEYGTGSCIGHLRLALPSNTHQITTMNIVFGNSGKLLLIFLPALSPKSIAGCLLSCFPSFLGSWT